MRLSRSCVIDLDLVEQEQRAVLESNKQRTTSSIKQYLDELAAIVAEKRGR